MSTYTDSIYIIMHREQGPAGGGAPTSRGTKVGKSQKGADFGARYLDTARSHRKSRRMSTCTNSIYIIVHREQGPTGGGAPTSRGTKVGKIANELKPESSKPEPPIVNTRVRLYYQMIQAILISSGSLNGGIACVEDYSLMQTRMTPLVLKTETNKNVPYG